MSLGMFLFLFIAALVVDRSHSLSEHVTYPNVRHQPRKSFGSDLKKLMGVLRQENNASPKEQITNFTQLVMNFVNSSYKCGSEEAQKVVPQIVQMIKGIFKIPFVDFFVDSASQENVLKALEECASKKVKRERKRKRTKKRHKNKIDETEWRAFFTGAIENAEPREFDHGSFNARKANRTKNIDFKSILDDIIKAGSVKSQERSRDALLKIILEIDDYLRREKERHKQGLRFKSVSNRERYSMKDIEEENDSQSNIDSKKDLEESRHSKSNRDSIKDLEEPNDSKSNRHFRKYKEEENESKSNRDYKKYLEGGDESTRVSREFRAGSGTVELKTSDEVVFDQNMEISVRMDGSHDN